MRLLLALLLAAAATGCVHPTTIPDQAAGPVLERTRGPGNDLAVRVGTVREHCREARKALRAEARDLERRHNLMATLGATFGASGGAAALGATSDAEKGVKTTLAITSALLSAAGAVATTLSSKDSDLLSKLQERALKVKTGESELDWLVAKRKVEDTGDGKGDNDEEIRKKADDLDELCVEP